jgi:hypothetical protein
MSVQVNYKGNPLEFTKYSRLIRFFQSLKIADDFLVLVFSHENSVGATMGSRKKINPLRLLKRFKHKKFRGRGSFTTLFNVQIDEPPIRRALLAPWGESIISRSRKS